MRFWAQVCWKINTSCLEKITLDAKVPDVVERQSCAHRKCLIGTKTLGLGTRHFVAIYTLFGHNFRFLWSIFVVLFAASLIGPWSDVSLPVPLTHPPLNWKTR